MADLRRGLVWPFWCDAGLEGVVGFRPILAGLAHHGVKVRCNLGSGRWPDRSVEWCHLGYATAFALARQGSLCHALAEPWICGWTVSGHALWVGKFREHLI